MAAEGWVLEEPWNEFVVLHFADVFLLERPLPGPQPRDVNDGLHLLFVPRPSHPAHPLTLKTGGQKD